MHVIELSDVLKQRIRYIHHVLVVRLTVVISKMILCSTIYDVTERAELVQT